MLQTKINDHAITLTPRRWAETVDDFLEHPELLLGAEDIADAVIWVATRPEHVQIAQMTVLPVDQASTRDVNKQS